MADFTFICGKAVFFAYCFAQNTPDCSFINPKAVYSWCYTFLCWYVESGRNKCHCSRVHDCVNSPVPLWISLSTMKYPDLKDNKWLVFFLLLLELEFLLLSRRRIMQQYALPSLDFIILHELLQNTQVYTSTEY